MAEDEAKLYDHMEYYLIESAVNVSAWSGARKDFRLSTLVLKRPVHVSYYPTRLKIEKKDDGFIRRVIRSNAMSIQCSRVAVHQPVNVDTCSGSILVLDKVTFCLKLD